MFNKIIKDKRVIIGTIITVIAVVITLVISIITYERFEFVSTTDAEQIKNEYEFLNNKETDTGEKYPKVELSSDNIFKYSTINNILDIFEEEKDAVIFFGSPTCIYCRSVIQVLCDTSETTELETIHYLDTKTADANYDKLLEKLDPKFTINDEGKEIYKPLVLFITDGVIVSYQKDTVSSHQNPYATLDKDQIEGLSFIYKSGINNVVDSIKLKESVK